MTNARVEVVTSVQRRRRWSTAEKEKLVAATLEPGASVSAVAHGAGMHPSQLYGWRRQLGVRPNAAPRFTPVRIATERMQGDLAGPGAIEIEFADGARMRIAGAVDPAAITAAVAALAGGPRG